ncbi:MAG: VWA domain-containing protein [Thermoguttaceae bacterium]|nr:VWA domain-containing protein [Thermoguttaceae bacterium]MBQ6828874.1 VWA domain-containing protein [Thermoguttaceae bacterium]
MARSLPVYLLLDISGSMAGAPIQAVDQGLGDFVDSIAGEPQALETMRVGLITFDSTATQLVPMCDAIDFNVPPLKAGGRTALGAALKLVKERAEVEVQKNTPQTKGDWRPLVFIMTDGVPTDENWLDGLKEFKKFPWGKVVACAAGPNADISVLQQITSTIVQLDVANPSTIRSFFQWVSQSAVQTSARLSSSNNAGYDLADEFDDLPAPPPGINFYR